MRRALAFIGKASLALLIVLILDGLYLERSRPKHWTDGLNYSAENYLRETLRDPDSATVRNAQLRIKPTDAKGDDIGALCGEVNAKNGFGGYTGFQRFVVPVKRFGKEGRVLTQMIGIDGSADRAQRAMFNATWGALCS